MSSYDDKAEATREFYRKQGEQRERERLLSLLFSEEGWQWLNWWAIVGDESDLFAFIKNEFTDPKLPIFNKAELHETTPFRLSELQEALNNEAVTTERERIIKLLEAEYDGGSHEMGIVPHLIALIKGEQKKTPPQAKLRCGVNGCDCEGEQK